MGSVSGEGKVKEKGPEGAGLVSSIGIELDPVVVRPLTVDVFE
jgi:hypothetical protein